MNPTAPQAPDRAEQTPTTNAMSMTKHAMRAALSFAMLVVASAARAEELAEILKKPTLAGQDRGVLEAELSQRFKRVFAVSGGPNLNDARAKLVAPIKEKDVSPAGLDAFAEVLCGELERYVGEADFNTAMTATLVIEEMNSLKAVDPLIAALKSAHAAVRYTAARGLQSLRAKMKDDESTCKNVLAALGAAGAEEKDEHALRRIYIAMNFKAAVADFKYDDLVASAVGAVLESRQRQLASGSRDEYKDEEGLSAAAACYAGASAGRQAALIDLAFAFLRSVVAHYFDSDAAPEALSAITRQIQRTERIIHDMIKASKASPPGKTVSELTKSNSPDRLKQKKDAEAALEALRGVLRGEPWKLS